MIWSGQGKEIVDVILDDWHTVRYRVNGDRKGVQNVQVLQAMPIQTLMWSTQKLAANSAASRGELQVIAAPVSMDCVFDGVCTACCALSEASLPMRSQKQSPHEVDAAH